MRILEELTRRRLIQTAALYIAVAWGGTEILVFLVDALFGGEASASARRYLAILLIAGFPAAMYLAWTRDLGHRARQIVSAGAIGVVITALLVLFLPPADTDRVLTVTDQSIAVLPFEVCEDQIGDRVLAGGMTGAVFSRLAQRDSLKVKGRRSVEAVAGTADSLSVVARLLGVEYLLSGTVCREGLDLTLHVEVVDNKGFIVREGDFRQGVNRFDQVDNRLTEQVDNFVAAGIGDIVYEPGDVAIDRNAFEHVLIAEEYLRQDENEKALAAFEKALEFQPDFAEARFGLARLDIADCNIVDEYGKCVDAARTKARAALELVRARLREHPSDFKAHETAGYILFRLARWENEATYRDSAELDEEEIAARQDGFLALYEEAEEHFRAALAQNPSATDMRTMLAASMDKQGVERRKESLQVLEQGLDLDPFDAELSKLLAHRQAEFGRLRDAMLNIERFRQLPQGKAGLWWTQVEILQSHLRFDEKLEVLIDALGSDPADFEDLMMLGHLWWTAADIAKLGLLDEAEELHVLVSQIPAPDDSETALWVRQTFLVDFYDIFTGHGDKRTQRDLDQIADMSNEEILETWRDKADFAAWTFWDAGQPDRAIELMGALRHYVYPTTTNPQRQMWYSMGLAYMYTHTGRDDDAAGLLEYAAAHLEGEVDAGVRHPESLMLLAEAYGWLGDKDAALDTLDLAIEFGGYEMVLCCEEYVADSFEDLVERKWWEALEDEPRFALARERMRSYVEQQRSIIRALMAQNDMQALLEPLMKPAETIVGHEGTGRESDD